MGVIALLSIIITINDYFRSGVPKAMAKKLGFLSAAAAVWSAFLAPVPAAGHCDTLDGPVVAAATDALAAGDVTPVLKWVAADQEGEIRAAFAKALAVRGESPTAQELADTYFFETLVRLHRETEGAPYTGLKPAGAVEPAVAAADEALARGDVGELVTEVGDYVAEGIRRRFERTVAAQAQAEESVAAGREYVAAYVDYVHYVEGVAAAAEGAEHGHNVHPESAAGGHDE
jgi:hypothetical protein